MQPLKQSSLSGRLILKSFIILFVACALFVGLAQLPQQARAATRAEASTLIGFPGNAAWTWSGKFTQAWLGQIENDAVSGDHVNFHIQPKAGGSDFRNYHITYKGIVKDAEGNDEYQWNIYDSVDGGSETISESTALGPEDAATYATQAMATFVQNDAAAIDAADLQALVDTLENSVTTTQESPITQAFYDLIAPVA